MVDIVRKLDSDRWRKYVDEHPQGNIFHTPEMYEVFSHAKGYTPSLWANLNKRGDILALLLPVNITLIGGLLYGLTTRAVVFGGVLSTPTEEGRKGLRKLLSTYKSAMAGQLLFTELRNLVDMTALDPILHEQRFEYEDHLNYLIDLDRPVEDVLQNIGRRTRKVIRRGLRAGDVVMSEVENLADLQHWYDTLQKTYGYSQIPLADRSMFEAAFDILHPKGMAKFLLANVEGETASCSVELIYKDCIYGWYGGTDRDFSKYTPNELLMWHILEWGANNGYKVYDFGGAGKPDEEYGVRDFKAKFNGKLVNYGRHVCVHAPSRLILSELGYSVYRKFL